MEEGDEQLCDKKNHSDEKYAVEIAGKNLSGSLLRRWKALSLTAGELDEKVVLNHWKSPSREEDIWEQETYLLPLVAGSWRGSGVVELGSHQTAGSCGEEMLER